MNNPTFPLMAALGLAFSSALSAQSPPPAPPPPSTGATAAMPAAPSPLVTHSSRVRAFNIGPGGEVRSLYLQNGSVVDVTPALGGQLGPALRKGARVTVTGTESEINGQSLVEAASLQVNGQTFSANAPTGTPPGPGALADGAARPPMPAPSRRNKAAERAAAPCDLPVDAPPPPPDFGGPPPPPPDGLAPPPPPPQ